MAAAVSSSRRWRVAGCSSLFSDSLALAGGEGLSLSDIAEEEVVVGFGAVMSSVFGGLAFEVLSAIVVRSVLYFLSLLFSSC